MYTRSDFIIIDKEGICDSAIIDLNLYSKYRVNAWENKL